VPLQAITSTEPIPGYRISERIGAGGYGEVWRADAPGGLVKAIKFVYGFLTEDRAARELKALNRIKSVRHPFLLSLERIEVVDGQLLIVTELADASLKDCFDEYQKEGQVGIPWEELIRFMRDAADVLDYMSEEHSLQHLDIKPENLLLLAGRVKVADFGLVKDIHDATASMMGGLTPLYAPPEVFDGRPSRWSDQYSLAIVYQEMLTGELPFPGTTAIQLARQHLNARPRLSALPERDQEIIARALAKSPKERFNSCRELVDALQRAAAEESARGASSDVSTSTQDATEEEGEKRHTEVLDDAPSPRQWYGEFAESPIPRVHEAPQVNDLPPIEIEQQPVSIEPTLFLGVGRSAGRILVRLRSRLSDRFQSLQEIPSLQMLLIDTDGKDLSHAAHRQDGFRPHELLGTPLRRPQDYRGESRELLRWLSRRWLYNIPRSLKTEGLRPLGRLAMVDHADEIIARLRQAIETATSEQSLARSQETSELEFANGKMRVVVVASIAGGTGSGMVVDLGYLARHVLGEMGFPDDNVCGVLTHSTGRNPSTSELAVVNTYATLSELNHFGRLGSHFPGERSCGLPPRKDDNVAFRDTYLIDVGQGLSEDAFDEAVDQIAEYLYLDTATAAHQFLSECRNREPRHADTRNAEIPVRSFGLHQYSCMQDDVVSVAVEHLCHYAAQRWVVGRSVVSEQPALKRANVTLSQHVDRTQEPAYSHLRVPIEKLAESLQLNADSLIGRTSKIIEEELGKPADDFITDELQQLLYDRAPSNLSELANCINDINERMNSLLGNRQSAVETGRQDPGSLENALAPRRRKLAVDTSQVFRDWLLQRVEQADDRIRGAQWAAQWFSTYCRDIEQHMSDLHLKIDQELEQLQQRLDSVQQAARGKTKDREKPDSVVAAVERLCRLRLYERVVASASGVIRAVKGQVSAAEDELMDLERELRHLAKQFDTARTLDTPQEDREEVDGISESVGQILIDNVEKLTGQLESRLQESLVQEAGGLRALLMQGGDQRNRLPMVMRGIARSTVVGIMKQLDASDMLFQNEEAPQGEVDTLSKCLTAARPRLLACGGAKRLLVMLPKGSSQVRPIEVLHEEMNETPSVVENCDGDFILCYEAEQISLTQAAVTLIEGRRDLAEAASRLHTRNDVNWSNLPDLV
jgi:serine/threonine protein kinase